MDSLLMTCKQCWWCNTLRSKTRPEKSQYIETASQVSDLCYQTFMAVSFTKECYITNLFAFCLETTKSIFVNPIALNIFHAILSYFIFLDFTIEHCAASEVYGENLWIGVTASWVSDLCFDTFLAGSSSAECYTLNLVRILPRDYPYYFCKN